MKHVAVIYMYEIRNWTRKVHSSNNNNAMPQWSCAGNRNNNQNRNCEILRTARSRTTYVNAYIRVLYTNEIRYSDHSCLSGKRGLRLVFSWSPQMT